MQREAEAGLRWLEALDVVLGTRSTDKKMYLIALPVALIAVIVAYYFWETRRVNNLPLAEEPIDLGLPSYVKIVKPTEEQLAAMTQRKQRIRDWRMNEQERKADSPPGEGGTTSREEDTA